ncbi:hypothetical protein P154DRAFT_577607 [Amniculicola lignicola CBS 123094]|uniref:Uncharacterized protein n=1 Tax=Amniculicola lignicola CBS 123094 TaxID=1392246 RepID=A0A6A5WA13_9PLEO|nr:hypothetical protein P154DRAFT_577607 [Amniculicola lignicola CBS 123094]
MARSGLSHLGGLSMGRSLLGVVSLDVLLRFIHVTGFKMSTASSLTDRSSDSSRIPPARTYIMGVKIGLKLPPRGGPWESVACSSEGVAVRQSLSRRVASPENWSEREGRREEEEERGWVRGLTDVTRCLPGIRYLGGIINAFRFHQIMIDKVKASDCVCKEELHFLCWPYPWPVGAAWSIQSMHH